MTSWSRLAPSTSITPSLASQARRARSLTVSTVSEAETSSSRFFFACSTLISEEAMRMFTVRAEPASKDR